MAGSLRGPDPAVASPYTGKSTGPGKIEPSRIYLISHPYMANPARIVYDAPSDSSLAYQVWKARCSVGKRRTVAEFIRLWRSDPVTYMHDPSARMDVIRMLQEIGASVSDGVIYVSEIEGCTDFTDILLAGMINHFVHESTVFPERLIEAERAVQHVLFRFKNYWISPTPEFGSVVMEQFLDLTESICHDRKGERDRSTPGIIRTKTRELQCYGRITSPHEPIEVVVHEYMVGSA